MKYTAAERTTHSQGHTGGSQQLRDRHGNSDGVRAQRDGQQEDQNSADDKSPQYRGSEGYRHLSVHYIPLLSYRLSPTGVEPSSVFTGGFPSGLRYCPCKAGKALLRAMPSPGKNPLRKNCLAHLSE